MNKKVAVIINNYTSELKVVFIPRLRTAGAMLCLDLPNTLPPSTLSKLESLCIEFVDLISPNNGAFTCPRPLPTSTLPSLLLLPLSLSLLCKELGLLGSDMGWEKDLARDTRAMLVSCGDEKCEEAPDDDNPDDNPVTVFPSSVLEGEGELEGITGMVCCFSAVSPNRVWLDIVTLLEDLLGAR